jgi:hypothetical protein
MPCRKEKQRSVPTEGCLPFASLVLILAVLIAVAWLCSASRAFADSTGTILEASTSTSTPGENTGETDEAGGVFGRITHGLGPAADIITLVSIIITSITLLKVRSIAASRRKERALFSRTLNIDGIQADHQEAAQALGQILQTGGLSKSARQVLVEVRDTVNRSTGALDGALRAIREYQIESKSEQLELVDDYYSVGFLKKYCSEAHKHIRIVCVRNRRLTETDVLGWMRDRLKAGCQIQALALSPESSDSVLVLALGVLPEPKANGVDEYRKQVEDGRAILADWTGGLPSATGFRYREYVHLPLLHMVQADNIIYLGFQYGFLPTEDCALKTKSLRVPAHTPLGKALIEQFVHLWDLPDTRDML